MMPVYTYMLAFLVPAAVGVIFIGIGAALVIFGLRARRKAQAAQNWPSVQGVVSAARIDAHSGRYGPSYLPVIVYDYTVAGTPLQGSQIRFNPVGGAHRHAEETLARYPAGSPVTVFYNPNDLNESVLERDVPGILVGGILGAVMGLVGLGLLCFSAVFALFFYNVISA